MRTAWYLIFVCFFAAAEPLEIKVGGYDFVPFHIDDAENQGLTAAVIDQLNQVQDLYRFTLFPIRAQQRYQLLESGRIDMILFEDLNWGWTGLSVNATEVILHDVEEFVTSPQFSSAPTRELLLQSKLVLVNGYHYGFADMNSDREWLQAWFDVQFVHSQATALEYLRLERRETTVVARSFLNWYESKNQSNFVPQRTGIIDQEYDLRALVSQKSTLDIERLQGWLKMVLNRSPLTDQLKQWDISQFE